MTSKAIQQISSALICMSLLVLGTQPASAFPDQTATLTTSQPSAASAQPAAAPLTTDQLDALVAPIICTPMLWWLQVLGRRLSLTRSPSLNIGWQKTRLDRNCLGPGRGSAVMGRQREGADSVSLNPGQHGLHLVWTSNLGQAFHDQPADVMAAVQTMRAKAQAAGTLRSTPQSKSCSRLRRRL